MHSACQCELLMASHLPRQNTLTVSEMPNDQKCKLSRQDIAGDETTALSIEKTNRRFIVRDSDDGRGEKQNENAGEAQGRAILAGGPHFEPALADLQVCDFRIQRLPRNAEFAAAPEGPRMRPWLSASAASIISLSRSASVAARGADIPDGARDSRFSHASSTENVSPSHRITALSITFCSSRMFPGQSCA